MGTIENEVHHLAARVASVERQVVAAASQSPTSAVGPDRLQAILPEVKALAAKVGGLGRLADIVQDLA
jgi:hypothetical protein